jgi:hypothetical protein
MFKPIGARPERMAEGFFKERNPTRSTAAVLDPLFRCQESIAGHGIPDALDVLAGAVDGVAAGGCEHEQDGGEDADC